MVESGGELVGVLPLVQLKSHFFGNFFVSVPHFNYGGALYSSEAARQALLKAASELAQAAGCSHMELRDTSPMSGWPARTDKVAMWLTLPESADALWQTIGSKVRAQIKKSREAELKFSFGGAELLDDFYRVFSIHMRDLGTPVYGKHFFATILRSGPGQPVLVVGSDPSGKPVSVAMLLRFGQRIEVPWASTLRSAHGANANMALYWQLLSYACEQGCRQFDFGRSTQDAPTYRFKKQWGAQPVQLHWHYWLASDGSLPQLNPNNPNYKLAIGVWKRLPVWLTRLIGPPIVRNLP
jgi:FemAB-related protein (PEP-CTERM system-associated)